jgi:site-specific DNA-methyltransferase (adenine-specific)
MELNKIYNGDCLNLLKQVADKSVDMCFADPPFNLKKKYNVYKDKKSKDEYLNWCNLWLEQLVRVTKDTGSIFVHNIPYWLTFYCCYLNEHAQFRHWIAWDAPTTPMGKSLQPAHYGILYYAKDVEQNKFYELRHLNKRCRKCGYLVKDYGGKKDSIPEFGPLVSDCFTDIHRIKHDKYRDDHPCQLPVHLLERLILMSTDENDVVLDPFIGTGTTSLAAKRLGRQYLGFEISKEYADAATRKLEKETTLSKVGNSWVVKHLDRVTTIRHQDWPDLREYFALPGLTKELDFQRIELR